MKISKIASILFSMDRLTSDKSDVFWSWWGLLSFDDMLKVKEVVEREYIYPRIFEKYKEEIEKTLPYYFG